jgi:hypothetical protein
MYTRVFITLVLLYIDFGLVLNPLSSHPIMPRGPPRKVVGTGHLHSVTQHGGHLG